MEEANAQTVATFTGTLLKRQRMPGKPFVQLIFREAEKDWLCLSSNLKHVASLQIGKKYQIEGIFRTLGEHQYIHEPEILPIAREIKKRRVLISLGLGLGIILAAGGIVLAATHDPSAPPRDTSADNTAQHTTTTDDTSTGTPATTPDTPPTTPAPTTTPATPPTPKPTPKPKTTSTPAPVVTPPPANNNSSANNTPPPPPPAPIPPAAPQGLSGSWLDSTDVQLSWSDSDTPDHFVVYRDGKQVGVVPSGTSYTDSTADPTVSHDYYVVAVAADGTRSGDSTTCTVPAYAPPAT